MNDSLPPYPGASKGPKEYNWKIVHGEFIQDSDSSKSSDSNSAAANRTAPKKTDTFDRDRRNSASSRRNKYLSLGELVREFITEASRSAGIGTSFDRFDGTPHFILTVQSHQDNRPTARKDLPSTAYAYRFAFVIGPGTDEKTVISIHGHGIFESATLFDDNKYEQARGNGESQLLADIIISPGQSARRPVENFVAEIFSLFRKYPQKLEDTFKTTPATINENLTAMCVERPVNPVMTESAKALKL